MDSLRKSGKKLSRTFSDFRYVIRPSPENHLTWNTSIPSFKLWKSLKDLTRTCQLHRKKFSSLLERIRERDKKIHEKIGRHLLYNLSKTLCGIDKVRQEFRNESVTSLVRNLLCDSSECYRQSSHEPFNDLVMNPIEILQDINEAEGFTKNRSRDI